MTGNLVWSVEFDAVVPAESKIAAGVVGGEFPDLPGWFIGQSLGPSPEGHLLVTVTSPELTGEEGLEDLVAAVDEVVDAGLLATPRTGFRVIIPAPDKKSLPRLVKGLEVQAPLFAALLGAASKKRLADVNHPLVVEVKNGRKLPYLIIDLHKMTTSAERSLLWVFFILGVVKYHVAHEESLPHRFLN
jgi:hypothetical protein